MNMAQDEIENRFKFVNGIFDWNNNACEIVFISHEAVTGEVAQNVTTTATTKKHIPVKLETSSNSDRYEIEFKDDFDLTDKIRFNRKFRREVKELQSNAILLQDVKDVVLYTANPKTLTSEFIMLLHIPQTDDLFRAGIIYFQFFFQTWDELRNRREELERKIFLPNVKNSACEDLSDLRAMFAIKYFALLIGKDHYHTKTSIVLSERDRQICEMLIHFATRVFWYALNKPPLNIIEQEVERLCRSNYFNKFNHMRLLQNKPVQTYTASEKRILWGRTEFEQTRLTAMTPMAKELMYGIHDHRMLAIGQIEFPPVDDRLRYMEKLYLLPEEDFEKNNICIGVLGMNRDNFEVMLKPKHRPKLNSEEDSKELLSRMEIPPYIEYSDVPWRYPTKPTSLKRNFRQQLLIQQCQIWLYRLRIGYKNENTLRDTTSDSVASSII